MATEVYTHEVAVPDLFEAPPFSLYESVTWLTGDPDGHWRGGIQYEVTCPVANVTVQECFPGLTGTAAAPKAETWDTAFRGSRPFTLYDEWDCSPPGRGVNADDLVEGPQRAQRALSMTAPDKLEYVFWTGSVGNTPAVAYPRLNATAQVLDPSGRIVLQPSATLITGGLDVVEGMERLEDAVAACYKGVAWIHVPVILMGALANHNLCYERGGKLYTYAGNRVIVGRGYPDDVGPNGVANAAGVTQMWATSPVFGIRGTVRSFSVTESLDRSVNTLKSIAEQTHILGWHCCLVGVTVTTGGVIAGAVNAAS